MVYFATYAQHGNLNKLFFYLIKQFWLHTWPYIINNLIDLRNKYNFTKSLLEDTNN
jgi:hypothetical protein